MPQQEIPAMVQPSTVTTVVFVLIVAALAVAFVVGVARGGGGDESDEARRRWTIGAAVGTVLWLAVFGAVSASGILETPMLPPPAMLFMVASMLGAIIVAFSRVGARLSGLPVAALVGFQAFRLPLEIVLHQWAREGVLPVQMTFNGHNFDIVTGVLAIVVGALARRGRAPRALVLGFNVVGLGLLITVGAIAIMSSPIPLRTYFNDPPVLLAFYFPYGWIVPVCVAGALLGHLLVFRALARREGSPGRVSEPSTSRA